VRAVFAMAFGWLVAGTVRADVYLVGDTDRDACDYATVQDAIDSATANGPALETILIANTGTYTNVTLVVGDKSLIIEGGFDSCANQNADAPADLGGSPADTVISIQPSAGVATQVTLRGLRIHDGGYYDPVSGIGGNGGGVYIVNGAVVTIEDTTIENNIAGAGAGIYLQRNFNIPTLQINPGVKIRNNHAHDDGGGVYVYSYANLYIAADGVNIDDNIADHDGGGLAATDRALISIGNPGMLAPRHDVTGTSISGNSAGMTGGGIALSFQAQVFAYELILDSNTAALAGGGIALTHSGYAYMARDYLPGANEFQCPSSRQCSRISNNSVGSGADGTHGGAIAMYSGSRADIAQTIIRGNTAQDGSAVYVDDGTVLNMESVLVTGNQSNDGSTGGKTIRTNFSVTAPQVRIAYATFADNHNMYVNGNYLSDDIQAVAGTQLSIFSSAFYDVLDVGANSSFTDDCEVSSFANLPSAYGTYTRDLAAPDPGFVNAAAGDYRPRGNSPLVDYCDASAYAAAYRDLLLTPRCQDNPGQTDHYGTCDVGAYEYDPDHIFADSFE